MELGKINAVLFLMETEMSKKDLKQYLQYAQDHMAEHRGAFPIQGGAVIFGNDGEPDSPKVAREIEIVREWLADEGLEEKAFGTNETSWVMEIKGCSASEAKAYVWNAWRQVVDELIAKVEMEGAA